MKKFTLCLTTAFILIFSLPTQFKAEISENTNANFIGMTNTIVSEDVKAAITPITLSITNQSNTGSRPNDANLQNDANASISVGGFIVLIMLIYLY